VYKRQDMSRPAIEEDRMIITLDLALLY